MSVDGELIITSCKEDSLGLTVTFYDKNEQPVFSARTNEPMARIRHILPVKLNYVYNGETTRAIGILPLRNE